MKDALSRTLAYLKEKGIMPEKADRLVPCISPWTCIALLGIFLL